MRILAVQAEDGLTWERMRYALWPGEDETHGEVITAFFAGAARHDPAAVLLMEDGDGVAIGFVELSIRTDLPGLEDVRIGYVEGLYVVPAMRAKGMAYRLLVASRTWAREQGCAAFASDRDDRVIVDSNFLRKR